MIAHTTPVRITRIEIQKKRRDRVNIYLDGEFALGLSKEILLRAALRVGDELPAGQIATLTADETLHQARTSALRLLGRRPRSEKEIHDRLREKEFGEDDITRVIDDLRGRGLLNDPEFARMFIRNALTLRPQGEIQLRQKLLLLGVARSVIDDSLKEIMPGVDVEQMARTLAQRYLSRSGTRSKHTDPRKRRQLVAGMLARRGYAWSVITQVLQSLNLSTDEESHDLPGRV